VRESVGWAWRTIEFRVAVVTLVVGFLVGSDLVPAPAFVSAPAFVPATVIAPAELPVAAEVFTPAVALDIPLVPLALWNLMALLVLLSGLLTGGLAAILTLFGTGFQTGLTAATAVAMGVPIGTVILLIAPHSLLEVPSLLLVGSIGLRGFALLRAPDEQGRRHYLPVVASASLLLLVAALIEAFGTPFLVSL